VSWRQLWSVVLLALAVSFSGVAAVYSKYLSRKSFVELEGLRAERDQIDIDWARLQLEEAALSTHVRVERKARQALLMHAPGPSELIVVGEGDGAP
jgi:cell division protein FtsL